jgi:hypothetical protein
MKTIRYIVLGMLLSNYAIGQSTVNTTGGSHRKGNLRLDWNVGEMALVNTLSSPFTGNIITNGVIQPQAGVVSAGNKALTFEEGEIRILPNPTRDLLGVGLNMQNDGQVTIQLFDVSGKMLYSRSVAAGKYSQVEQINMSSYVKGNYMLKVEFVSFGYKYKEGFYKIIKVD